MKPHPIKPYSHRIFRAFDRSDFRKARSISFKRLMVMYLAVGALVNMMLSVILPTSAATALSGILLPWIVLYTGQSRALALGMLLGFTVNLFAPLSVWGDMAVAYVIAVAVCLIVRHRLPQLDKQALLYMSIIIPLMVVLIVYWMSTRVFCVETFIGIGSPVLSTLVNLLTACVLGPLLVVPMSMLLDYLTGRRL